MGQYSRRLIAAFSLLLLASCAGSGNLSGEQQPADIAPQVGAETQPASAALPAPSVLAVRSGSYTPADGLRQGKDFDPALPNNLVLASATLGIYLPELAASPESLAGLAYAIYNFTLPDYDGLPKSIDFTWSSSPPTENIYYALANWGSDRWVWHSDTLGDQLFLDSLAPFLSDQDQLLLVVAVAGSAGGSLTEIRFQSQGEPVAVLVSDKTNGPAPLEVDFDASASSDDDGTLAMYEWDLDGDGLFNEVGVENAFRGSPDPAPYTYTESGIYDARVRVEDNDGNIAEATLTIVVTGGPAPEAVLTAEPVVGSQPLEVLFDASGSHDPNGGVIVLYEWDFDSDEVYNENNGELQSQGEVTPNFIYTDNGVFDPHLRVTSSLGGQAETEVLIEVGNSFPVAVLKYDKLEGEAPLSIVFDASESYDSDGVISQYRWDFNGNGYYDETGIERDARDDPTPAAVMFENAGYYDVSLLVRDDDNASGVATVEPHVLGWQLVELANGQTSDADFAIVGGKPAAIYTSEDQEDGSGDAVYYSTTIDELGDAPGDWTTVKLYSFTPPDQPTRGRQAALAEVAGSPAICYGGQLEEDGEFELWYQGASGSGTNLADWPEPALVDDRFNGSQAMPRLIEVQGRPAVAYKDVFNQDVWYAHSASSDGQGSADWDTKVMLHDPALSCDGPSMQLIGGNPAIAFIERGDTDKVLYCRSSTPGGDNAADWASKIEIASLPGAAPLSLYGFAAGPAISYSDGLSWLLQMASATDSLGQNWAGGEVIHPVALFPYGAELGLVGEYPVYAARSLANQCIYSIALNSGGVELSDWPRGIRLLPDSDASVTGVRVEAVGGKIAILLTRNNALTYAVRLQ